MLKYFGIDQSVQEEIAGAVGLKGVVAGAVTGQMRSQEDVVRDIIWGIRHSIKEQAAHPTKRSSQLEDLDYTEESAIEYNIPYQDGFVWLFALVM